MKHFNKKSVIAGATIGVLIGMTVTAVAYFTTTGAGSGAGSVGTSSALVLHQTTPVNGDYSAGDGFLYPGTTQTVKWTVDNNSPGHQYLNKITLASWTSDKTGCDSATQPTWITMPDVTVAKDYDKGAGQTVTPTGTVTFNNFGVSQDACENASITFSWTSN